MLSGMGYAETILQAARAWHIAATGLDVGKVIPADDKGTRPALPYLTIRVGVIAGVGSDERREHASGRRIIAQKRATVTVQAFGKFGDGIEELLEAPSLALADLAIIAANDAAGLTIERIGPILDVPALLDTAIECRKSRDYAVTFKLAGTAVSPVALVNVGVTVTYTDTEGADPTPLVDTFTVS